MLRQITVLLVVFAAVLYVEAAPQLVGGPSEIKDITPEVRELVVKIRPKYEGLTRAHTEFEPIKYRIQTVAGSNYFIKVRVEPKEFIHIRVHVPLKSGEEPSIHGILHNKKETDPLEYFDGNM